jgi:hypothetical protein
MIHVLMAFPMSKKARECNLKLDWCIDPIKLPLSSYTLFSCSWISDSSTYFCTLASITMIQVIYIHELNTYLQTMLHIWDSSFLYFFPYVPSTGKAPWTLNMNTSLCQNSNIGSSCCESLTPSARLNSRWLRFILLQWMLH